MADIIAVSSDEHPGSMLGLCAGPVSIGEGSVYMPNEAQEWSFDCYNWFWDRVEQRAEEVKADDIYVIHNGDAADKNKHESFQIVSGSPVIVKRVAQEVFKRPKELATHQFFTKGTAAHSGTQGWMEDWLAEELGAEKDPDTDEWSWWYIPLELHNQIIEFCHAPATRGLLPHTEDAAPPRMQQHIITRCSQMKYRIPDCCVYSHVHYYSESGRHRVPLVIYTAGWQLPYDYVYSKGRGQFPRYIGGLILTVDDGRCDPEPVLFTPKRKKPWTPNRS